MAMRKIIESDISGKTEAATVTFGLGDTWYEIDLTAEEEKQLESALKTYLKAGRKAEPKKPEKKKMVPETTPEERDAIRAWGRKNALDVPPYGRIPKDVMAAYDKAHNIKREK